MRQKVDFRRTFDLDMQIAPEVPYVVFRAFFYLCMHVFTIQYGFILSSIVFLTDSLSSQYNPDTIMALLQTSVAQLEETSEVL